MGYGTLFVFRVSLKISFDSGRLNFDKLSYIFRMFRVMGASKLVVYAGFWGSKSSFHFLLRAQKKTKQKKRAPATKPIFPSKRAIQPLWPAYPHASNVPRCSWMSPLHTPFEFSMVPELTSVLGQSRFRLSQWTLLQPPARNDGHFFNRVQVTWNSKKSYYRYKEASEAQLTAIRSKMEKRRRENLFKACPFHFW